MALRNIGDPDAFHNYLEYQRKLDIQDVQENLDPDLIPDEYNFAAACKLLQNQEFIQDVAFRYRRNLDNDNTWYDCLMEAFRDSLHQWMIEND